MTFVPRWILGDLDLTEWPLLSLPDDYGSPENVMEVVDSLLADGSVVSSDRTANRTITHTVWIEEADSAALATAEAALIAETDKQRNTFTIEPGDGFGYATVFDTFRVQAQHVLNMDEERAGLRRYDLTIPALPYGRSVDEVSVTATPTAASPTVVDGGTATTNWTTSGADASDVAITATTTGGRSVIQYAYSGPGVYSVVADYTGTAPTGDFVGLTLSAPASPRLNGSSPTSSDADGSWTTYYWPNPGAPFQFTLARLDGGVISAGSSFYIDALVESPGIGFDSLLAVQVFGSVRTTGRYTISRGSGMRWVTLFSDPAMALGAYHPAVPATYANAPEGTYAFWMEPRGGLLEVTVTDAVGQSQTMTTDGQWENPVTEEIHPDLVPVGELTLGGTYDGLVGALSFEVRVDGIVEADPATYRLFRKHRDTSLTHVLLDDSGGTGGSVTELVVESPSVARPFGGVWADGVSVIAKCLAWEDPTFAPEWTYLFVEANTSSSFPVTTTAAYYPRHHTHATR